SGITMFLLCRELFGFAGGCLGAAAYVFSPYFHVDLYIRRALAEFTAFAFYPLALYGFARHARDGSPRALCLGSLASGAVFVSHNPAALLFTPIVTAFALFQAWRYSSRMLLVRQMAAIFLGVAAAAFVWMPIIMESGSAHIERVTAGYFDF